MASMKTRIVSRFSNQMMTVVVCNLLYLCSSTLAVSLKFSLSLFVSHLSVNKLCLKEDNEKSNFNFLYSHECQPRISFQDRISYILCRLLCNFSVHVSDRLVCSATVLYK